MLVMKRKKPYEIKQGNNGIFVASGLEPIDSQPVSLRMTQSMYKSVEAAAGSKKQMAEWIRQAIADKLN
ncbi:hypothetical protein RIVM261_001590 [Rivularia sp. IAM M-261]|nr:hypothetical protein RIVM261_001590 [Rivularia sp. IAM M-261]